MLEHRPKGRPARSVLEVRVGRLLRSGGPFRFVRNHAVLGADGKTYELDFAFLERKVALEADGQAFHSTANQIGKDRRRQQALEAAGWRFLRVGWWDVVMRPEQVLAELRALLAADL